MRANLIPALILSMAALAGEGGAAEPAGPASAPTLNPAFSFLGARLGMDFENSLDAMGRESMSGARDMEDGGREAAVEYCRTGRSHLAFFVDAYGLDAHTMATAACEPDPVGHMLLAGVLYSVAAGAKDTPASRLAALEARYGKSSPVAGGFGGADDPAGHGPDRLAAARWSAPGQTLTARWVGAGPGAPKVAFDLECVGKAPAPCALARERLPPPGQRVAPLSATPSKRGMSTKGQLPNVGGQAR